MKQNFLIPWLLLCSFISFGQITFERGYLINSEGQRFNCLIKNIGWKNNPKEFDYKFNEEDIVKKGDLLSVKEFGIDGSSKFIRTQINIDRSPDDLSRLTTEREPVWSQEQIFLKVLIEGNVSLLYYEDHGLKRFFYFIEDTTVKQLIYKEYIDADNNVIKNNTFKQQLWVEVRCNNIDQAVFDKIYYEQKSLEKYFINYNLCKGGDYIVYEKRKKSDFFNLKLSPGVTLSTISMWNNIESSKNALFESQWSFRLGIEAEFLMPFNNNKWAFLVEPAFEYFNSSIHNNYGTIAIHYKSIEFPLGIRHYFFLNKDIKLFPNLLYIPGAAINFNSDVKIDYSYTTPKEIKTGNSFAFGAGISYKNLSSELRYYTNRDILASYTNWFSSYRRISIIVSYTIF